MSDAELHQGREVLRVNPGGQHALVAGLIFAAANTYAQRFEAKFFVIKARHCFRKCFADAVARIALQLRSNIHFSINRIHANHVIGAGIDDAAHAVFQRGFPQVGHGHDIGGNEGCPSGFARIARKMYDAVRALQQRVNG